MNKVRIGTRGSRLALWQAHHVAARLEAGGLATEIVIIDTTGDKLLNRALSKIGSKGLFTAELEEQLFAGQIDIAQHSAKDLPSTLPEGLELIAFTERESVNDVLVSFNPDLSLVSAEPFTIGTSSTRRVATLRRHFPQVRIVDMRGNLQTRLQKLRDGHADALLLAYAGVHRMAYDEYIVEHLPTDVFTPAVGQGSVAIECARALDPALKHRIRGLLNHDTTEACICCERTFLAAIQGGCSIPVFGLATVYGERISLDVGILSLDGQQELRETGLADLPDAPRLARQLAERLLRRGGEGLLREIRAAL